MKGLRRLAVALGSSFAVALALLLSAPAASAHAVVVGSDPADGSRLKTAPTSVTVRFDEPVGLALGYLRVVDEAGRRVDVGSASHPAGVSSSVRVNLKTGLGDGTYLASFRVVSADTHPVGGSIRFVVGNGPLGLAGAGAGAGAINRGVEVGLGIVHWLSFAGVGVVGGSWLIFSIWPAGQRRRAIRGAIWTGWTAAVLGALGEFLLQGPYAAGTSLSSAFRGDLLDATLHVSSGQLLSLRLVLLGILGAVLTALLIEDDVRRPSWGPEAAAIVGVGIVVTYAAAGHSQTVNPKWFGILVDALHLSAMVIWLGGLAILLVGTLAGSRRRVAHAYEASEGSEAAAFEVPAERDGSDGSDGSEGFEVSEDFEALEEPEDLDDVDARELAAGLPLFSRVALACVLTLAVTGTIQAWREVGAVDAITQTWYGRLVLTKVVLFLGIVGLGYFAKRIVQRRDWNSDRGPLQRMRRTLVTEVVVGATVLAVTGVLISQPPGKVALAAERSQAKVATVAITGAAQAKVTVTPGTHGSVEVEFQLSGAVKPVKVTATASLPAKSLGPIAMNVQAVGPSTYTASNVLLPSAGDWQILLTVQTSAFDSTTAVAVLKLN